MKRTPLKKPKLKKCPICKEKKQPFPGTVCSYECSIKYMNDKKEKEWAKERAERRDKLKTHSDWSKELQDLVNLIARLIDKDVPCISSLRMGGKIAGGHRWSVGANPNLRFNLLNIHAQSFEQNSWKSGNPDGYDNGLRELYGAEYLAEVHGLKEKYPVLKMTIPELIEAKARAKKIIKSLKELNLAYPPKMRIELRKKYNKALKIYND